LHRCCSSGSPAAGKPTAPTKCCRALATVWRSPTEGGLIFTAPFTSIQRQPHPPFILVVQTDLQSERETSLRISPILFSASAVLLGTGVITAGGGVAGASFSGNNGALVWSAVCLEVPGQQIWSAPNQASGLTCPSSPTTPISPSSPYSYYIPVTAGATDSMPYFESDGSAVFFSSSRPNSGGTSQNAIWTVKYPNTVTGSTAPYIDNAVQLTNPSGTAGYDYAPTVSTLTSGGEQTLAWIRCTNSSGSNCGLWTETLTDGIPSSTAAQITTIAGRLDAPNNPSGDGNRPEIDPQNSNLILYEDNTFHIHLASVNGAAVLSGSSSADVDLSALSVCPACQASPTNYQVAEGTNSWGDEHPDWSPDGTTIVFDSGRLADYSSPTNNQGTNNIPFTMTIPTSTATAPNVAPVWNGIPSASAGDSFIEPVYAPNSGTASGQTPDFNTNPNQQINPSAPGGTPPTLAWITTASGSNVSTLDDGNIKTPNPVTTMVTNNQTNNLDVDWQPTASVPVQTPESPVTIALPLVGGGLFLGAGLISRRWRRKSKRPMTA
jgi:hypothetical protein